MNADGLTGPVAGELTLPAVKRFVDQVVLVSDDEITTAMGLILERTKLLAEPAGAATAALLCRRVTPAAGTHVGLALERGNIDQARLKARL